MRLKSICASLLLLLPSAFAQAGQVDLGHVYESLAKLDATLSLAIRNKDEKLFTGAKQDADRLVAELREGIGGAVSTHPARSCWVALIQLDVSTDGEWADATTGNLSIADKQIAKDNRRDFLRSLAACKESANRGDAVAGLR